MKIKPNPAKMLKVIIITGIVCVILTLIPGIINGCLQGFGVENFIATFAVIGASIIFSICSFTRACYFLEEKCIVQQYLIKKKSYPYDRIAYIDDLRSRKTKTLVMYMDTGQQVMMVMDKNGKLLYEMLERATKRVSRVEFLKKHPTVNLS